MANYTNMSIIIIQLNFYYFTIEKFNDLIGNRICDLPACNIVPQSKKNNNNNNE
jgi:hypothetical protein